eukprot:6534262-Pyramimonas_sp.AAC.1
MLSTFLGDLVADPCHRPFDKPQSKRVAALARDVYINALKRVVDRLVVRVYEPILTKVLPKKVLSGVLSASLRLLAQESPRAGRGDGHFGGDPTLAGGG